MTQDVAILGFDHAGARVVDRGRSLAFYGKLGFWPDPADGPPTGKAIELINAHGVRLHLIVNGCPPPDGRNVLMDLGEKWPGWTHPAFIVGSMDDILSWAQRNAIAITEGPVDWGRRRVCFIRDPDGNVIEFDELLAGEKQGD
jgi:catechol 2,3-dioxygenase-like lactoylglutathione lyase family enzyme